VSLIKKSEISPYVEIDNDHIVYLKGITEQLMKTLGKIKINFGGNQVDLHVIEDNFSLPSGVLGTDVFRKCKTSINYGRERLESEDMVIPFLSASERDSIKVSKDKINKPEELKWGNEESWDTTVNKIEESVSKEKRIKINKVFEPSYGNNKVLGEQFVNNEANVSINEATLKSQSIREEVEVSSPINDKIIEEKSIEDGEVNVSIENRQFNENNDKEIMSYINKEVLTSVVPEVKRDEYVEKTFIDGTGCPIGEETSRENLEEYTQDFWDIIDRGLDYTLLSNNPYINCTIENIFEEKTTKNEGLEVYNVYLNNQDTRKHFSKDVSRLEKSEQGVIEVKKPYVNNLEKEVTLKTTGKPKVKIKSKTFTVEEKIHKNEKKAQTKERKCEILAFNPIMEKKNSVRQNKKIN